MQILQLTPLVTTVRTLHVTKSIMIQSLFQGLKIFAELKLPL